MLPSPSSPIALVAHSGRTSTDAVCPVKPEVRKNPTGAFVDAGQVCG